MRKILILLFSMAGNFYGFAQTLNIAIAASLQKPFEEIGKEFEKETGIEIKLISASSGALVTQIRNNAPFDIFISANRYYAENLLMEELVSKAEPFCTGSLVWWSRNEVAPDSLFMAIQSKKIKTLAIANPELAPYGKAAKRWLEKNNLISGVKLVNGENIGSVNRYIYSMSVDAAITSLSSMYAEELKPKGYWYPINEDFKNELIQAIVMVKESDASKKFFDFVLSESVEEILEKYGYISLKK